MGKKKDKLDEAIEEPIDEPEPEPMEEPMTKAEPKPDTITARVNSCTIRAGDIDAKRGDTIEIPTDPDKHSPALANAIKNRHIVIDLAPVISEDAE